MNNRSERKLLHLVISGTDWQRLEPLMSHGLMPALSQLIEVSSIGDINSPQPQVPIQLDHAILTGTQACDHGLAHCVRGSSDTPVLVTDADSKVPMVQDWIGGMGLDSISVGWPHLNPRWHEHQICLPRLMMDAGNSSAKLYRQLADDSGDATIQALKLLSPENIGPDHLRPFFADLDDETLSQDPALEVISWILAEAGTVQSVATRLMQHRQWSLASIRFEFIDRFEQLFGDCHPPVDERINPERLLRYQSVITGAYRFLDLILERLITLAGEHCTLIIHSEKGVARQQIEAQDQVHQRFRASHEDRGFLLIRVPGDIEPSPIWTAGLVDIAPTMLACLGLRPTSNDGFAGRIIHEALQGSGLDVVISVDRPAVCDHRNTAFCERRLAELEQRGELKPDNDEDVLDPEGKYYLYTALNLLQSGECEQALVQFEALSATYPDLRRLILHRARCHTALAQYDEAEHWIGKFLDSGEADIRSHLIQGQIAMGRQQPDRALMYFFQAEQLRPEDPMTHCQIGSAYRIAEQHDKARNAYQRALKLNPAWPDAHLGLARIALLEGDDEAAVDACMQALESNYRHPDGHFHLGVGLARLGKVAEAIQAFEMCLKFSPGRKSAHQWLARLYSAVEDGAEEAAKHQALSL